MPELTKNHFRIIRNIAHTVSTKTGIDVESLEAECIEKIPVVLKNFVDKLEVPFDNYFAISMRGYCLNYRRDKSFISTVPRKELSIYLAAGKYRDLKTAASRMGLTEEYLEELNLMVQNNKNFDSLNSNDEWLLPHKASNSYVELFNELDLEPIAISILEDYYLDGLTEEQLVDKYGSEVKKIMEDSVNRIKYERDNYFG